MQGPSLRVFVLCLRLIRFRCGFRSLFTILFFALTLLSTSNVKCTPQNNNNPSQVSLLTRDGDLRSKNRFIWTIKSVFKYTVCPEMD